ncbi:MAG: sigma-70 family RNA polymerase sigma factor [Oscillospiraceae bacterium]|jgi:RNA polymerase sigma factor (sigma-70 family)|nr:sigma-70 family RNA polymerase sigma factor [Oscillospiraceae bacterium]
MSLSLEQQKLVSDHMDIVKWAIYNHIQVNEHVQELGYDDLYQVGCLALCVAAMTYDHSTQFQTYAQVVVRNRLIGHCRQVKKLQDKLCYLETEIQDASKSNYAELIPAPETPEENRIYDRDIELLLSKMKSKHTGITLKGIEAIELKLKGYTGKEIAALYGVKPNLLGAWISRAKNKLKRDDEFMAGVSGHC